MQPLQKPAERGAVSITKNICEPPTPTQTYQGISLTRKIFTPSFSCEAAETLTPYGQPKTIYPCSARVTYSVPSPAACT